MRAPREFGVSNEDSRAFKISSIANVTDQIARGPYGATLIQPSEFPPRERVIGLNIRILSRKRVRRSPALDNLDGRRREPDARWSRDSKPGAAMLNVDNYMLHSTHRTSSQTMMERLDLNAGG